LHSNLHLKNLYFHRKAGFALVHLLAFAGGKFVLIG
jgi:hypothetical protein